MPRCQWWPMASMGARSRAVADEASMMACIPRITALGYTYRGYRGASQGHFFDLGPEQHLTHYLHMLLIDDAGCAAVTDLEAALEK